MALALALIIGAIGGYFFAQLRSEDKVDSLSKQLAESNRTAAFVHDRFFFNDQHNFALIAPAHWTENYAVVNSPNSSRFSFRQSQASEGSKYYPVFVIYKCKNADYEQLRGKTADTSKCPGDFLRQDEENTYTWKVFEGQKQTFVSEVGDSDKIIADFKRLVLPTFLIVRDK